MSLCFKVKFGAGGGVKSIWQGIELLSLSVSPKFSSLTVSMHLHVKINSLQGLSGGTASLLRACK